jgi:hypothetical protein
VGAPLLSRLLEGAIAGFAATAPMTTTMVRLHARLPPAERYPLPPRELVEPLTPYADEETVRDATLAAHFGFGALAGAVTAAALPRMGLFGWVLAGTAVWAGSYLGWAPAAFGLRPATEHPVRRTAVMLAAHLVWGLAAGAIAAELARARGSALAAGPLRDRRRSRRLSCRV